MNVRVLVGALVAAMALSACYSRTVERETVIQPVRPAAVEVVPAPVVAPAPPADTTVIIRNNK